MRRKRLKQHKLTMSPTRPQQEVSPNRRYIQERLSESTLSPKREVYVEECDKTAAARATRVIEKVKRTEDSALDEAAILDDKDEPQIDFADKHQHSEGELHSDEEAPIAMDTDPLAEATQRTLEITSVAEFPEIHIVNRTRQRREPDKTTAVAGKVPRSDLVHSERELYDLDLEFLSTCKLPKIRQDSCSYQDFTSLTAINFSYTHAGVMLYSSKFKRQTKTHHVVIPSPVSCVRFFVARDDGRPRCYAVITLHWGSESYRRQALLPV